MQSPLLDRRGGTTNRRRFTRIPARQLRGCLIARGIADNVWVVDISLGGAFLRTPEPLPLDEPLALELPQSGHRPALVLRGHVVSRRVAVRAPMPPGMGVCFDQLTPLTLAELRELIRSFAPVTALETTGRDDDETRVAPLPSAPNALPGRLPVLTAAEPLPLSTLLPQPLPSAPRPLAGAVVEARDVRQLRFHVKGLLFQVGELQSQLSAKTRENGELREAIARLQASNAALRRG